MDRHYIPVINEGMQGIPEDHPENSTMFMAGFAQNFTQNKKGAAVYHKRFQVNTHQKRI